MSSQSPTEALRALLDAGEAFHTEASTATAAQYERAADAARAALAAPAEKPCSAICDCGMFRCPCRDEP